MTCWIDLKKLSFLFLLLYLVYSQPVFAIERPDYFYSNGKKIFLEEIISKPEYNNINYLKRLLDITDPEFTTYEEIENGDELTIKDDYLVSFRNEITDEETDNIIDKELNSEIIEKLNYVLDGKGYHLRLREPANNVILVSNKCIETNKCIWAHPNFIRKISLNALPADTYTPLQWYIKNTGQNGGVPGSDINIEKAWEKTKGNSNITIAVIDDSFDWQHEEFNSQTKIAKRFNLVEGGSDTRLILDQASQIKSILTTVNGSFISHGTSVGGLIAAPENGIGIVGVCPNCMLMPIKIATSINGSDGKLSYLTTEDKIAADAIVLATDQGAAIINNSWSGIFSDVLRNAIDYAQSKGRSGKGAIVVFSSGNGLKTSCQTSSVYPPGNYLPVITVGASDKNDKISCYSSTGPEIDVVAPGGDQAGDIVTADLVGVLGYSPKNVFDTLKLTSLGLNESWQLQLYDLFFRLTGTLNNWSLEFIDINNTAFKFESSSMSLPIPDGLGSVIPSPGNPLITTIKPSLNSSSSLPLIKDIFLNLDVTHTNGSDLEGILVKPSSENVILSKLSPTNFPQSSSFIPINKLNIAHANNLPVFELDDNGNYTSSFSGTSASSAIVSGATGLILSVNPNLTYIQVDQILKDTADKIDQTNALYDSNGHSNIYGFGRINALRALQKAEDLLKTNTTTSMVVTTDGAPTMGSSSGLPETNIINENEPNNKSSESQLISVPLVVKGSSSISDAGDIEIVSKSGGRGIVTDLYKINITEPTNIKASLKIDGTSLQDNLDLVLLNEDATKLIELSLQESSTIKVIQKFLQPGVYYFGVAAISGSSAYTLSIIKGPVLSIDVDEGLTGSGNQSNANGSPLLKINGEEVFILLPELKKYVINLEVEANNFKSTNRCRALISSNSQIKNLNIIPSRFSLSPKKTKRKIKIKLPYKKMLTLIKDNSTKIVTLDVKCTNDTKANKSILVKPQSIP